MEVLTSRQGLIRHMPKTEYVNPHMILNAAHAVKIKIRGRKGRVLDMIVSGDIKYLPQSVLDCVTSDTVTDEIPLSEPYGTYREYVSYEIYELTATDGRLLQVGLPEGVRRDHVPVAVLRSMVHRPAAPKSFSEHIKSWCAALPSFSELKEKEMLTLVLKSDGDPADAEKAVSLAYNLGVKVVIEGVEPSAVPEPVAPAPVEPPAPVVEEPHPVWEPKLAPVAEEVPNV